MKTTKTKQLKTRGYVILNEENLTILNDWVLGSKKSLLFFTEEEANAFASTKCNSWSIIRINMEHKFIQHSINAR